jgi:hypothetical protein
MSPTFRQLFVQIDDNTNVSIVRHERQTGVPSQVKSPRIYGDVVNSATKITEMFYSVISTATIADDDFISFPKPTMPFFNMFVFVLGNGVGHDFWHTVAISVYPRYYLVVDTWELLVVVPDNCLPVLSSTNIIPSFDGDCRKMR